MLNCGGVVVVDVGVMRSVLIGRYWWWWWIVGYSCVPEGSSNAADMTAAMTARRSQRWRSCQANHHLIVGRSMVLQSVSAYLIDIIVKKCEVPQICNTPTWHGKCHRLGFYMTQWAETLSRNDLFGDGYEKAKIPEERWRVSEEFWRVLKSLKSGEE